MMRVEFTYNQEDLIDATERFLRRSKTMRAERWKAIIFLTLFSWLAIYVVFISLLENPYLAVIVGVVSTLSNVALFPVFHERGIKKRLRKFFKERHGDQNAFSCEVELTPHEIRVRDENCQIVHKWGAVEEIVETEDSVDLFSRTGGVVVRDRAFQSRSQREEFISLARRYLAAAQSEIREP